MNKHKYTVDGLIEDINLSNNGYNIEKYMHPDWCPVVAHALELGVVRRTAGVIHLANVRPYFLEETFPSPAKITESRTFIPYPNNEPDFEAAILDRQEWAMLSL